MLASASDPGGEGHFHEGHFRPIHVETRPGSMFHPEPPRPGVLLLHVGLPGDRGHLPRGRRCAARGGPGLQRRRCHDPDLVGELADTGEAWADGSGNPVGQGATAVDDGPSAIMHHGEAGTRITPVEVWEAKNPWVFERFELRVDSCGPGRHRGGLGVDMFFHMLDDCWLTCGVERTRTTPGACWAAARRSRTARAFATLTAAATCSTKATGAKIPKGSTFELSTGGGGGYGPPSERDPEAIAADVRAGYITEQHAREHYPQYRGDQS